MFVGRHTYYGAVPDAALYRGEDEPPMALESFPELADLVAGDLRPPARVDRPGVGAVPRKRLIDRVPLHGAHIDPYSKAALVYNHEPRRARKLLAHRREIKKLEGEMGVKGTTLIPLAIYFKGGRAKVEIGVGHGKQQHDKRDAIRKKEMDREVRRAMSHRQ